MMDKVPKKTIGDHLHLVARTGVASIPVWGGAAVELFNSIIGPPLERRRNEFLEDVLNRLKSLEEKGIVNIDVLSNNEVFVSTTTQATATAIRNHNQEKRAALRNAVLQVAIGSAPEDIKCEMFVSLVDEFTGWHLSILAVLADPKLIHGGGPTPRTAPADIAELAMKKIPELRSNSALATIVVEDLARRGLLFWNSDHRAMYIPSGTTQVSPLGMEFLAFISDPELGEST